MSLLFGVLLVGLVQVTPIRDDPSLGGASTFLALMQFSLVLLNLLLVPGLDGYGVLEPHLPRGLVATLAPMRRFGLMLVFALIWWTPVLDVVWRGARGIGHAVGLSDLLVAVGAEPIRAGNAERPARHAARPGSADIMATESHRGVGRKLRLCTRIACRVSTFAGRGSWRILVVRQRGAPLVTLCIS